MYDFLAPTAIYTIYIFPGMGIPIKYIRRYDDREVRTPSYLYDGNSYVGKRAFYIETHTHGAQDMSIDVPV